MEGSVFTADKQLISYCRSFITEYDSNFPGRESSLDALSLLICQFIIRCITSESSSTFSIENSGMDFVIQYIYSNYHNKISIAELAETATSSEAHFSRLFKKYTSMPPGEFILETRLTKSRKHLKQKETTITQTALLCGFSSSSHFSTQFKKRFGISPLEYQNSFL